MMTFTAILAGLNFKVQTCNVTNSRPPLLSWMILLLGVGTSWNVCPFNSYVVPFGCCVANTCRTCCPSIAWPGAAWTKRICWPVDVTTLIFILKLNKIIYQKPVWPCCSACGAWVAGCKFCRGCWYSGRDGISRSTNEHKSGIWGQVHTITTLLPLGIIIGRVKATAIAPLPRHCMSSRHC